MESAPDHPRKLETLFDGVAPCGRSRSDITVGELIDRLAHRSFGPLLLLPALVSVLPVIGALPGVTWTTSAICLVVSLHFLFQRHRVWLPGFLRGLSVPEKSFCKGLAAAKPWLRRLDGVTYKRFHLLLLPPAPILVALLCVVLSVAMFVFSVIPGGVVIPAAGIILLAIALTTHDGLLLALGVLVGAGAVAGAIWLLFRFVI
ncbi:exopolysaccharide biosynthesis protein [Hyphobacterium marinum]|uniref:Exopolysaccharide biosynthesis protein n=1 Tax=Hyphobacterium marinum TaxID=3116574 RepID=A0ABU7M1F4_9PROT|nr:exopolysaccharide biosynthesis protein [Hyphobacterium sp. Y6023]MEE2567641.1 exopolysaccharide biosynthesis protein [Hyphobacterium sp. Y6023]